MIQNKSARLFLCRLPVFFLVGVISSLISVFDLGAEGVRSFDSYLPDTTVSHLSLSDLSKINSGFNEGPFGEFIKNKAVVKFFKPLTDTMNFDEFISAFDVESEDEAWKELYKYFPGEVVFSLALPDDYNDGDTPEFVVMARYEGDEKDLKGLLKYISDESNPPEGAVVNAFEEDYLGAVLHVEEVVKSEGDSYINGWSLVDDILVIAHPLSFLKEVVSRIKSPDSKSDLKNNEIYIDASEHMENSDISLFINLERLLDLMKDDFEKGFQQKFDNGTNPMFAGVTAEGVLYALGIDALQSCVFSINMDKEKPGMKGGLFYSDRRGIMSLLAYQKGEIPRIDFIPSDVLSSTISLFDINSAWESLENMLSGISPQLGNMFALQMESYKTQTGLDFKESVLGSLGDVVVTATLPSDAEKSDEWIKNNASPTDQFFAISITDKESLSTYIEAIKDLMMPSVELFDKRDYSGETIYKLSDKMGGGSNRFSYAITDEYLFIDTGSSVLLEHAILSHHNSNNARTGLWDKPEVVEIFKMLPYDASEYSYSNMESLTDILFNIIAASQRQMKKGGQVFCDLDNIPEGTVFPYIMIAANYLDDNALLFESLVIDKEELE